MMSISQQRFLCARDGQVTLDERTLSTLADGFARVRVTHSAISPGTELSGLQSTTGKARGETMGYQVAGVVDQVSPALEDQFQPGDQVACYGGPYVYHASLLDVPRHLIVKQHPEITAEEACFCALASIALHGFRNSDCRIGETVAVIGLGLLGNLTAQVARAAGCRVATCETLPNRIEAGRAAGLTVADSTDSLTGQVQQLSANHGADAVLVATGSCNDNLLLVSCELVRRMGNIVILGLADAHIPRAIMFSKEARLMVSRAAGWGRYDSSYERDGRDYPYEHARWTEGRNLEEVIRLMGEGSLRLKPLITDRVHFTQAAAAYIALKNNPSEHLGTVIEWN